MQKRLVKTQIAVGGQSELPLDGFAERYLSPNIRAAVPDDCRPPVGRLVRSAAGLFFSLRCNLMPDRPSPGGVISGGSKCEDLCLMGRDFMNRSQTNRRIDKRANDG